LQMDSELSVEKSIKGRQKLFPLIIGPEILDDLCNAGTIKIESEVGRLI